MLKNIAVMTSGGDSPGMNAAIRAIVRVAINEGINIWGIYNGYQGLGAGNILPLDSRSVGDIIHRGGTFLGTARCEKFKTHEGRLAAVNNLRQRNIEGVVVIGGDGSMRGAQKLTELGIMTVGLPGTIDNDIWGTDYTIGFDTAVNTVVDAINKLRDTASSHGRIIVVEVMGRASGSIALTAGIAGGAECILVPEIKFNLNDIAISLKESQQGGKRYSIVVVAEGAGSAVDIGKVIQAQSGLEVRVSVLGHIQRGGSPTVFDRILASNLGEYAVKGLIAGMTNVMFGYKSGSIVTLDMNDIINHKRTIDLSMLRLASILSQ